MSPSSDIIIQKCSTFNLRAISVLIPRTGLTLVCGPAGSGKSALLQHSLAAESARRLGRIALSGLRSRMISSMTIHDSSRGFEINSVAPVIDLSPWIGTFTSNQVHNLDRTLGISLGLDQAVTKLFSTNGRPRCIEAGCFKDGAALLRRTPGAVAAQLVNLPVSVKSREPRTFAICGVIEAKRSLQKAALEAFESGHRRFVVGEKYFRCADSGGLKPVFSALKGDLKPLAIVLKTVALSEDVDSSGLLAEIEASLSEATAEWKKVAVVPRAESGEFLWASAIYVADGLYQCGGCGRTVVLPSLLTVLLTPKIRWMLTFVVFSFHKSITCPSAQKPASPIFSNL